MTNFHLTPDAKSDLIKIRHFTIKQWGSTQSKKYLSALRKTICLLANTSSLGKPRSEIGVGVLSFPHVSHVIYYMLNKKQLVVFAVLHKSMIPLNHLPEREKF